MVGSLVMYPETRLRQALVGCGFFNTHQKNEKGIARPGWYERNPPPTQKNEKWYCQWLSITITSTSLSTT